MVRDFFRDLDGREPGDSGCLSDTRHHQPGHRASQHRLRTPGKDLPGVHHQQRQRAVMRLPQPRERAFVSLLLSLPPFFSQI